MSGSLSPFLWGPDDFRDRSAVGSIDREGVGALREHEAVVIAAAKDEAVLYRQYTADVSDDPPC